MEQIHNNSSSGVVISIKTNNISIIINFLESSLEFG